MGMAEGKMGEKSLTKNKPDDESSLPHDLPKSTPPEYSGHTLSTTIEIYRTLGRVEQAIENLSKQHSEQSKKIDDIGKTVHIGKGILIAASVILSALGGIAVFFLNKIWHALIPLLQTHP